MNIFDKDINQFYLYKYPKRKRKVTKEERESSGGLNIYLLYINMLICKGKTKLGKRCKCKCKKGCKYCKRHQTGGVKTGNSDLDRLIGSFADLQTLDAIKKVSKNQTVQVKELQKRGFEHWELLKNFNTTDLNTENSIIIANNFSKILENKNGRNLIAQDPITSITIRNLMKIQLKIPNRDDQIKTSIFLGELTYIYTKNKNDRQNYVPLITVNIERFMTMITTTYLHPDEITKYAPKLKKLIHQFVDLL